MAFNLNPAGNSHSPLSVVDLSLLAQLLSNPSVQSQLAALVSVTQQVPSHPARDGRPTQPGQSAQTAVRQPKYDGFAVAFQPVCCWFLSGKCTKADANGQHKIRNAGEDYDLHHTNDPRAVCMWGRQCVQASHRHNAYVAAALVGYSHRSELTHDLPPTWPGTPSGSKLLVPIYDLPVVSPPKEPSAVPSFPQTLLQSLVLRPPPVKSSGKAAAADHSGNKFDGFNHCDNPMCCSFLKNGGRCTVKHLPTMTNRKKEQIDPHVLLSNYTLETVPCIYGSACKAGHASRVQQRLENGAAV